MTNPYFCYATAFAVALAMYPLGWSALYPRLSAALIIFLAVTIVLHILGGIIFARKGLAKFRKVVPRNSSSAPLWVTLCLYGLWLLEFLHAGGVPLLLVVFKHPFDYRQFGIPTLHVLIVTFSSFYTILLFHFWLSNRSKLILTLYIVNLAVAVLIYNRGMFLFNFSASVFLFLMQLRRFSPKHFAMGAVGLAFIFYLFGVMGNLRVTNEAHKSYSNDDFLNTGQATAAFKNSFIPKEFFWAYIYTTSPLANVEQNIRVNKPGSVTASALLQWFNNEIAWDFISKRINSATGLKRKDIATVPGPFNATTVYAGSYSYLGFAGLVAMASIILAIPVLYLRSLPAASPFFLTGLAILNSIFLFMIFDNTVRFSGVSFQLAYPVLLHYAQRWLPWINRIFL